MTAPVTFHAETFVSLVAVRGGVLDAPRSRDCRGWLGADVERDQPPPRHSRCARLRPPPNASNPAGTAHAPFYTGEPTFPIIPRREGVEALPYEIVGTFRRETAVVRRPKAGRRGRRPLRAVCLLQVAAFDVRAQPARLWYGRTEAVRHPRPGGRGSPPLQCEWGTFRRGTTVVRRHTHPIPRITCRAAFAPAVFYRQV